MAIFVANEAITSLMMQLEPQGEDFIPDTTEVISTLNELSDAIGEGGPEVRETMLDRGAFGLVCQAWALCCWSGAPDVPSPAHSAGPSRDAVLRALYTLTAGFPDIIDDVGWQIVLQAVDKTMPPETQILAMKLIRNVSIKSEENREHFVFHLGLLEPLIDLVVQDNPSSEFVREWCASIKSLLLSDDTRVPYNRATERKRLVANSRICPIISGFLSKTEFENDLGALNAMVILLGTMAVNEENCIQIEEGNVFAGINNIIKTHFHNKTLLRNSLSLLRYLACCDELREKISSYPFMKYAVEVINYYKKDADIVDVAVSCIGFMTIKNACQCTQFVTRNGLPLLMQTMLDFNKDVTILKGACFILRNLCENGTDESREKIVELGYATVFSQILSELPELKEYYIAPLVRELGLGSLDGGEEEEEEEEEGEMDEALEEKPAMMMDEEEGEDGFGQFGMMGF